MKSAYQMMQAIALTKSVEEDMHSVRVRPSKPNGSRLAARKHKRHITNRSKRRNRR